MKTHPALIMIILVGLGWGCTSTKLQSGKHVYTFFYQEARYEIINLILPTGSSSNYLVQREGDRILLRAKDRNLDGILDTLMIGPFELIDAQAIYDFGITDAIARGKFKVETPPQVYNISRLGLIYSVQTYVLAGGDSFNRLVMFDPDTQTETISVDTDADGTLDQVIEGTIDLEEQQTWYETLLERGQEENRIELIENRYVVKPAQEQDV